MYFEGEQQCKIHITGVFLVSARLNLQHLPSLSHLEAQTLTFCNDLKLCFTLMTEPVVVSA